MGDYDGFYNGNAWRPRNDGLTQGLPIATADLSMLPPMLNTPAPGFNDAGGMHDKLNGLAAALMAAGGNAAGAQALMGGIRAPQQPSIADLSEGMRKRGMVFSNGGGTAGNGAA